MRGAGRGVGLEFHPLFLPILLGGMVSLIGIAPLVPVYNALAVLVLTLHGSGGKRPSIATIGKQIATNPLILSSLAGLAFCLGGIPLPAAALSGLKVTGQIALPLALLAIVITLSRTDRIINLTSSV